MQVMQDKKKIIFILSMQHLVLGSSSPRRKEILGFFSYPFEVANHPFIEEDVVFQGNPIAYVEEIAREKGEALASLYSESVILTADTTVFHEGRVYNKPASDNEAIEMLQSLQGSTHSVFTGVVACYKGKIFSSYAETKVTFHSLTKEQQQLYHRAFSGLDKAGGYGIQKGGSIIIKQIEGCFYNVMGLPLETTVKVLQKVGIDLWNHL